MIRIVKIKYISLLLCVLNAAVSCETGENTRHTRLISEKKEARKEPVTVVIDKKAKGKSKIVIDTSIELNFSGDSTKYIYLKPGEHFVKVNDGEKRFFTVGKTGGLLNLDDQEYVAYEIKYTAKGYEQSENSDLERIKSSILIDSQVIIPSANIKATADSVLQKLLPDLVRTGNANTSEDGFNGLKKVGKGQLFINNFWHYNLNQKIPETITETGTSINGVAFPKNSTTRIAIMRADIFIIMASILGKDEYTIKNIKSIREGKEDKMKTKQKQNKQMEF